jgi:hypothetical protein
MNRLVTCIDPGLELGLVLGETYELVKVIDPWTVAVKSLRRVDVSPDHVLDTWQNAVWPEPELLSPRMAGRFVEVVEP